MNNIDPTYYVPDTLYLKCSSYYSDSKTYLDFKDDVPSATMTYKKNGKYRSETTYKRVKAEEKVIDNTPQSGFVIIGSHGGGGGSDNAAYAIVKDPRGFKQFIRLEEILQLINNVGYTAKKGFDCKLSWAWHNDSLTLIPLNDDEYQAWQKSQSNTGIKIGKCIPGHYYKWKNNSGYYLGQCVNFKVCQFVKSADYSIAHTVREHPTKFETVHLFKVNDSFVTYHTSTLEFFEDTTVRPYNDAQISKYKNKYIQNNVAENADVNSVYGNLKEFHIAKYLQEFTYDMYICGEVKFKTKNSRILAVSPNKKLLIEIAPYSFESIEKSCSFVVLHEINEGMLMKKYFEINSVANAYKPFIERIEEIKSFHFFECNNDWMTYNSIRLVDDNNYQLIVDYNF